MRSFPAPPQRLPWQRIGAFAIDWCMVAIYAGIWVAIVFATGLGDLEPLETTADRLHGQLFAFAVFTGPVILYFAFMEASRWQASIGKCLLGLKVVGPHNTRLTLTRSVGRSALKFLPWEVAHTAIWQSNVRPFFDQLPALNLTVMLTALAVALCFVISLFVGTGRTPYDRTLQTCVVQRWWRGSAKHGVVPADVRDPLTSG
jgi:uncharacterized RDD family membrane protein YckC